MKMCKLKEIDFSNNSIKELNISIFMNNKSLSIINKRNFEEDTYSYIIIAKLTKNMLSSFN